MLNSIVDNVEQVGSRTLLQPSKLFKSVELQAQFFFAVCLYVYLFWESSIQ